MNGSGVLLVRWGFRGLRRVDRNELYRQWSLAIQMVYRGNGVVGL